MGLQWRDFDFEKSTLLVQSGIVHGRVDDVKTEYSWDVVPIAPELASELLAYRESFYPAEEGCYSPTRRRIGPTTRRKSKRSNLRRTAKAAAIHTRAVCRKPLADFL